MRACGFALILSVAPALANASAILVRKGDSIYTSSETSILTWDSRSGFEHYVFSAEFKGKGRAFGLLIPTPTEPTLGAVDNRIFDWLTTTTYHRYPNQTPASSAVVFAQERQLSGFDAVVLKTEDAKGLRVWLKERGFIDRPESAAWLDGYIKMGWYITAFKIPKESDKVPVVTAPIRMTFRSSYPYIPYREPADAFKARNGADRRTQVIFLGADGVDAQITDPQKTFPWGAFRFPTKEVSYNRRFDLAEYMGVKTEDLPERFLLTRFYDVAPKRQNLDLTFKIRPAQ